jgi:hypothetical protein
MLRFLICAVHMTNGAIELRWIGQEFNSRDKAESFIRSGGGGYTGPLIILEVYGG